MMNASSYKEFEHRAVGAGVGTELANSMYNVVRDAFEHCWIPFCKDWAGDGDAMIARALKNPTLMAQSCTLLFATDGLNQEDGQVHAGISDLRRQKLDT